MRNTGVISMGIRCPIIREGDNLAQIVVDSVLETTAKDWDQMSFGGAAHELGYYLNNRDVIGITESVVARSVGNYVTLNEIATELVNRFGNEQKYILINPIYSRNRFSMILKAIARAASEVVIYMPDFDEVGNPSGVNQFTGVNIQEYYKEIVNGEDAKCVIHNYEWGAPGEYNKEYIRIYCGLHDFTQWKQDYGRSNYITLADICTNKCEYGLLGSNKANEEKLKLFPSKASAQRLVDTVQEMILNKTGKKVEVMIYGDGCFKDPVGGIWEFADPETSPAFTSGLIGTPNEIKIKAFADGEFADLDGDALMKAMKQKISLKDSNLVGNMASQGTTPRRFVDLLASLMDLTSGSGDKGTPIILVQHYFENLSID